MFSQYKPRRLEPEFKKAQDAELEKKVKFDKKKQYFALVDLFKKMDFSNSKQTKDIIHETDDFKVSPLKPKGK